MSVPDANSHANAAVAGNALLCPQLRDALPALYSDPSYVVCTHVHVVCAYMCMRVHARVDVFECVSVYVCVCVCVRTLSLE